MKTVITAEMTSAAGCAYRIPLTPAKRGRSRMNGTKQMPCLQAPRIKPSFPLPRARNSEEYTV